MKTLTLLLPTLLITGCARFHGEQRDISIAKDGTRREITTELSGTAWFSSAQTLTKFSANQTDRSQGFNGTGVQQQGATNTAAVVDAVTKLVIALRPTP